MISLRKSRKSVVEKCQRGSQSSVAEMQKGLGNNNTKKKSRREKLYIHSVHTDNSLD